MKEIKKKSLEYPPFLKYIFPKEKKEDKVLIIFTCGSTGLPKPVIYTQKMLLLQFENFYTHCCFTRKDRSFSFFFIFNLMSIFLGITTLIPKKTKDKDKIKLFF